MKILIRNSSLARHQWLTPVILTTWEAKIRRIMVWGQPRQIVLWEPISKITRAKWTGGVAQEVQRVLFKYETLSSYPSPTTSPQKTKQFSQYVTDKKAPDIMEEIYRKESSLWEEAQERSLKEEMEPLSNIPVPEAILGSLKESNLP
jgi:hypothetical protein